MKVTTTDRTRTAFDRACDRLRNECKREGLTYQQPVRRMCIVDDELGVVLLTVAVPGREPEHRIYKVSA